MTDSYHKTHLQSHDHAHKTRGWAGLLALTIGSVGVVYGDIGTSPLYALRESLVHAASDGLYDGEVLGVVSLLFWTLVLIVTLKYVFFLMFADNSGEGGTLSLLTLVERSMKGRSGFVFVLGAMGAALFYGDAVLTPAISVLSAVEGLTLVTPVFDHYVVPITVLLLLMLFAVQSMGTNVVAIWFGPIMLLWFTAMSVAAIPYLLETPQILYSFNPYYAWQFLLEHGYTGFLVLGSVFLAVTGAEALYADMGHFGAKPIRCAWIALVFPALILNYCGQGALVLQNNQALENPFFLMIPEWGLLPMVILATCATIIASQAVISGAYSLTRQAINLGLLPRFEIKHTSESQEGQIYIPAINWILLFGVLMLVATFKSSSNLASAYGIAVTGTMLVTSLLAYYLLRKVWKWSLLPTLLVLLPFIAMEAVFMIANMLKLHDGGYIPVGFAIIITMVMRAWVHITAIVSKKARRDSMTLVEFLEMLRQISPLQAPGTAIFMTSDPETVPSPLLHNIKHNNVLHANNIILTVKTEQVPRVHNDDRIHISKINDQFTLLSVTFGYLEAPNLPRALALCRKHGLKFDIMSTTFFVGRRNFRVSTTDTGAPLWQRKLFVAMTKSSAHATDYYAIPAGRVVELGQQIVV